MASLGQLLLVAGLAFLVLSSAQDQGHGGPAGGGGLATGVAAAAAPPARDEVVVMINHQPPHPLSAALLAESKRVPIPKSGPSDKWNSEVNHEKPSSSSAQSGGRRRTRAIVVGFP